MMNKFLFLLFNLYLLKATHKTSSAEALFGKSPDPNCKGDCKLVERYLAVFPLKN